MSTTTTSTATSGPTDPIGADLMRTLRALKLGGLKDTLPERLTLARARTMGHAAFLELVLSDEVTRRESRSAMLRARTAGLDPTMRLDTWDEPDDLTYDRALLSDLTSLRFTEAGHGVLILGPVGVGKTHLATALGHIGLRRRLSVLASRTDKLFTRLRRPPEQHPARRDAQAGPRRPAHPRRLRATHPGRDRDQRLLRAHRRTTPHSLHDRDLQPRTGRVDVDDVRALLAQSAIDRLTSAAHTLIIEGPSYRQRTHPGTASREPPGVTTM